jgi:UDP-N-acetylmuramoyl-L-alanyl-D-glutamate--2,6-diaminopimelate ligase
MKLLQLISVIKSSKILNNSNPDVKSLTFDSRTVQPESMFFALRGENTDGHIYIDNAVSKGSVAIVCEILPDKIHENACYIQVSDSHEAMGLIASEFYGNPSQKIKLIGLTGTNGKTTIASLLYNLLRSLGYKAGLLSTVVYLVDNRSIEATHTTPDAIVLNKLLAEMLEVGCDYCFMEVSSHAIVQKRISGLHFTGGVFTNITQDHLDFHKTFAEYIRAKQMFFDNLPNKAFALTNIDDRNGRVMVQNTKARVVTYSLRNMADFKCRIIEDSFDGMELNLNGSDIWLRFIGKFNAYNLLAVYAVAMILAPDSETEILKNASALIPVRGRFELVTIKNNPRIIIDYAHTPDALQNVIDTINDIRGRERNENKLITVIGCGGNRDKGKRPIMAHIAAENSDKVILTSDNPRFEDPQDILNDMLAGLDTQQKAKTLTIINRAEAIKTAVFIAGVNDIILIAGKGHENYQEIKDIKYHFDDKEEVLKIINNQ